MAPVTLILPRYIIPVRPHGQVLEGCGIVIAGDRIHSVCPELEARKSFPQASVVELNEHAVLPGLINMHTHSPMTLLRGYADDLALTEWLNQHIWPAESRFVDEQFVDDGTRLAIAEMIRSGTTCFNDNYFFPDVMARVATEAGMRAMIGFPLLDQATVWARNFDEYMGKARAVRDEFSGNHLVDFSLAPHAPYSVSDAGLDSIAMEVSANPIRVHLHCLETRFDLEHSLENYGVPPLERLSRHGLLNDNLIAVHMTQLAASDIEVLADKGTHVVHCPQSNLKLASGICPVAKLLEAGVNVSMGTDGAASNNNLDLLEEVRFAALLGKVASSDATAISAIEAVDMMTINGARALGLDEKIGSIEAGKQADLCAMNLKAPATQPLHNLHSQIVYAASSAQFTDVWVAGVRLLEDGALTSIDEPQVLGRATTWRTRMMGERERIEVAR